MAKLGSTMIKESLEHATLMSIVEKLTATSDAYWNLFGYIDDSQMSSKITLSLVPQRNPARSIRSQLVLFLGLV